MNLSFDYESPEAKKLSVLTVRQAAGLSCLNEITSTSDDDCLDGETDSE